MITRRPMLTSSLLGDVAVAATGRCAAAVDDALLPPRRAPAGNAAAAAAAVVVSVAAVGHLDGQERRKKGGVFVTGFGLSLPRI